MGRLIANLGAVVLAMSLCAAFMRGCLGASEIPSKLTNPSLEDDEIESDESGDFDVPEDSEDSRFNVHGEGPQRLFTGKDAVDDKLVGVVVTIYGGTSYDKMFREVQPTTVPGERVNTYSVGIGQAQQLHDYLVGSVPVPAPWVSLVDDVQRVDADSVVLNWECCSDCGDHSFPCRSARSSRRNRSPWSWGRRQSRGGENPTMRLMGLALRRGHTVMCSDFSLKSLLCDWSEEQLGPNPFLKVDECSGQVKLEFAPADLINEEVPQQLQVVGQLCFDRGSAIVNTMGDTIVYTVNPKRQKTDLYQLKVLTVASECDSLPTERLAQLVRQMGCSVADGSNIKRGMAGHVALTYKSGGQLITSMGHWIELTNIDASVDAIMQVAEHEFGEQELDLCRRAYALEDTDEGKADWVQKNAKAFISKSVPTRHKNRTKF